MIVIPIYSANPFQHDQHKKKRMPGAAAGDPQRIFWAEDREGGMDSLVKRLQTSMI